MSEEFLKKLIKAFHNYMELGAAVHEYNRLLNEGWDGKQIEEYIIEKTFRVL